ncbi:lytic transglycosylase domain-containing protein [Ornithinimicrobium sp. INDO-MA30-4]|uniref:lytic transglycosylase domain-containing protein n=1 Tax=Ornithinimicrobium sp. INDO-MA30-4 TaxID=2908651 RepID=UPI001F3BDF7B|nr:lytic transglycosylase domain-containing protein [Ornithinimicrobium sp. INDO-MA30-4]UJH71747.1 lytic transglycosylase domain-containing protein [Ornithinimicrobium sp. INDO-MA30-4]
MAERGAPLNGDPVAAVPVDPADLPDDVAEGGVGFDLPFPGVPVKASLNNPAQPIPTHIEDLYKAAAAEYNLPWTLLAGVGMEETNHDRLTATSTAGAQGAMQFMPATFAQVGVDGDGDGRNDINNTADSIYSAANYLVTSGATKGHKAFATPCSPTTTLTGTSTTSSPTPRNTAAA